MKSQLRNADSLARLGGDEFALLLMGSNLAQAQTIVQKLLAAVQDYRFSYNHQVFRVGASIGLIEVSPSNPQNLSDLLSKVDSACYAAKNDGGNQLHIYQPNDAIMNNRFSQMVWVARIQSALEQNEFVLYQQTIRSLNGDSFHATHAKTHCELLIRLKGEDGELYPPGSFLAVAERYHLMPQIDRWVVANAFKKIASKGTQFKTVCAINLSGQSLSQDGFLAFVFAQIKSYNIDYKCICFEITETAVIANLDNARHFMHALSQAGCRFSLDDFGSGLSSFAYLKNLEVYFFKN